MSRIGFFFPLPRRRTTMFFLRSFGPRTCTSAAGNPASSRRFAIASEAVVTFPTESVVLISISSLKNVVRQLLRGVVDLRRGRESEEQTWDQEKRLTMGQPGISLILGKSLETLAEVRKSGY